MTYVGRIQFQAKNCMALVDIAKEISDSNFGPIRIFTTNGSNSPDYGAFRRAISDQNLDHMFEFILNERDKNKIFSEAKILLLPSEKEGFGNVVVEAMSYGVPVFATSYAPGPADIINEGGGGFLLDEYTGKNIKHLLTSLDQKAIDDLSSRAFLSHRKYSVESHLDFLEKTAREAIEEFDGCNKRRVFPHLFVLQTLHKKMAK
ncbi:MAG: glycosyltransferase [Rhodobacterales bacterium]